MHIFIFTKINKPFINQSKLISLKITVAMNWQILWWLSWLLFHCLPSSHSLVQCSTTVHLGTERNFLWSLISNWSWGGFFARILLAKCHFQILETCATNCIHSSSMISKPQSISLLLPAGWWTATQDDPASIGCWCAQSFLTHTGAWACCWRPLWSLRCSSGGGRSPPPWWGRRCPDRIAGQTWIILPPFWNIKGSRRRHNIWPQN